MARPSTPLGPGCSVVITGAGGGLGHALAEVLSARGCEVVSTDLEAAGPVTRVLDVTDFQACRRLAEDLAPAVWVNNAGVAVAGEALEQAETLSRRMVEVNLMGVFHGSQAVAAVMARRGSGTILNIGSLSAWNPTPGLAVYAATKHAVRAYSAALGAELRGTGVRVTCLCPDGIWTPMLQRMVSIEAGAMPFSGRRLLEPEEVARAAVKLLESRRPLASLPAGRAVLAKASGLWPSLLSWTAPVIERQGRKGQAQSRRRLLEGDGADSRGGAG
jgi:short-subunit dehydrogenase